MLLYDRLQNETEAERAYLYQAPILEALTRGEFDREHYWRFLLNAYHHVRHTVRLMMACGAELPDRLHWLQKPLVEYIQEEVGHERWVLDDLAASGADVDALLALPPSRPVARMVATVYDTLRCGNPVAFFGMVYVLEGTSTAIADAAADLIQEHLELPDSAFSYLRSHGELDVEHVAFFEQVVNRIECPEDQNAVVAMAQEVFMLYGDVIRDAGLGGLSHAA